MSTENTDDDICAIRVRNGHAGRVIDERDVVGAVGAVLTHHKRNRWDISVALVDDAHMARLHQRYMNRPTATDVLTFDLSGDDDQIVEGEIVVSIDTAERESRARGIDVSSEVLLYVVHGVLHLLGYTDDSAASARRMHAMEDTLLTQLGVGPVYKVPAR